MTPATVQANLRPAKASARSNSFDGLRLLAAVFVVVGHGFVLTDHGQAPSIGGITIHALGVDVFFVISGYLISDSWLRDSRLRAFFARRALRILPALVCLVLVTVLVVGPTVSTLGAHDYFASPTTWAYLQNAVLVGVYNLPGVFDHGHWTNAVNGSLWTLGIEFIGYAVIALGRFLPRQRSTFPLLALLLVGAVLVLTLGADKGFGADGRVWVFFALGGLARHRLPRPALRAGVGTAALALWMLLGLVDPRVAALASWIAVPYVVLSLGSARIPALTSAARWGDLSYGLYLWGFLIQQLVIERFGNLPPAINIPITLGCTLVIAWLSWQQIEAPALRRKPAPGSTVAAMRAVAS